MIQVWTEKFPFVLPPDHELGSHLETLKEWVSDKDPSWAQTISEIVIPTISKKDIAGCVFRI